LDLSSRYNLLIARGYFEMFFIFLTFYWGFKYTFYESPAVDYLSIGIALLIDYCTGIQTSGESDN